MFRFRHTRLHVLQSVLPQGGLAQLRETVPCRYTVVVIGKLTKFCEYNLPCRYTVEKKVDLLNCPQGDYIYVATDHMT